MNKGIPFTRHFIARSCLTSKKGRQEDFIYWKGLERKFFKALKRKDYYISFEAVFYFTSSLRYFSPFLF